MNTRTLSILCIEDNADNMLVVQRIVESQAFHLFQAGNAEDGIEMARQYRPHIILMDMNLPGIDGIEATHIIKNDPCIRDIPVIAVTASSYYDKQTCLRAGCADYVPKPITMSKLLIVIGKYGV